MSGLTKTQRIGIVALLASILVGIAGMIWGVYSSFDALRMNESAGIGAVGAGLYMAILFSFGGFVGAIVGALLLIFGRAKANKKLDH